MKKIMFVLTLLCSVILGDEYAQVRANVENGICKDSDIPILDRLCQAGNGDACYDLVNGYTEYASPSVKKLADGRKYCGITRDSKKKISTQSLDVNSATQNLAVDQVFIIMKKKTIAKQLNLMKKLVTEVLFSTAVMQVYHILKVIAGTQQIITKD